MGACDFSLFGLKGEFLGMLALKWHVSHLNKPRASLFPAQISSHRARMAH